MHDDTGLVEERVRRVVREWVHPAQWSHLTPFTVEAWDLPGEPIPAVEALAAADWQPFTIGSPWGRPWGTTWFRLTGTVPADWAGPSGPLSGKHDGTVEALVDLGFSRNPGFQSEGLLYDAGGRPIRGIHPEHQALPVDAKPGDPVQLLVEAAANPLVATSFLPTPLGDLATAGDAPQYRLAKAHLAVRNDDVWHLVLDLKVLRGMVTELRDDDPRRHEILRAVERAIGQLDKRDVPATASAARAELVDALSVPAAASAHRISAIGHAHIDTAWLWPLRETRRKCARTFSTAVSHMEGEYPEHRFGCSQAVQWSWIKQDHPSLWERIRTQVDAGRFLPIGSMWVEADANLPSGESLARQFVHGMRFFREELGVETKECWIPDVFGYAGNLPQIMKLAGVQWFVTQKLSWNKTNRFPHNTFRWEGIDGSRIFTHFPPADTYNGNFTPHELLRAVRGFRDKGASTRSLYPFGHGDGGGGPTREHLELFRRVRDLDGLPAVTIEPPAAFLEAAEAEYPEAPVWRGELYFEMHRGTYTSQAKTKAGNRRCELALREAELWTAAAGIDRRDDLDRLWRDVLLHQFHDIIPGSSIAWVHDDTERDHARVLAELDAITTSTLPSGGDLVAVNAGPFPIQGMVNGVWVDAPAMGIGTAGDRPTSVPKTVQSAVLEDGDDGWSVQLDNGILRVLIGPDGQLRSVYDVRAEREALAAPANVLQLFPDHPTEYDAWDVDPHTLAAEPTILRPVPMPDRITLGTPEEQPYHQAGTYRYEFGSSVITQSYVLQPGSARLDIVTEVDWQEDEVLLKAAFPLDLRADVARYDVQYGHVFRPTHRNTSWDVARFEVCGHMWGDLSEPGFGAAILNDSKYGYDCLESTMRLTLLRAPMYPDPAADRGHHRFTYSLLVHDGTLTDVLREAWALNLPPRLVEGTPSPSFVSVDHLGVVVTAVKQADDGSGDLIVRMHEAFGGRARFALSGTGVTATTASVTDLHEHPTGETVAVDQIELRNFQILTLRLTP